MGQSKLTKVLRLLMLLILTAALGGIFWAWQQKSPAMHFGEVQEEFTLEKVPDFSGFPYVEFNGGVPYFTETDLTADPYEQYSELDWLGRCGPAEACLGQELMPTEERGLIGQVRPSGWKIKKYDFVDGKYLFNRCHLIAFQLTGQNDNPRNLITGTRYLNLEGMLPFEEMVGNYVRETANHVLYRVTPMFEGMNPLAAGVLMEAFSVEDRGAGVCFCVFVYNVQPGVEIDYTTGESEMEEEWIPDYVLNRNRKKFHRPECPSVQDIRPEHRSNYRGTRDALIAHGYSPCGVCRP